MKKTVRMVLLLTLVLLLLLSACDGNPNPAQTDPNTDTIGETEGQGINPGDMFGGNTGEHEQPTGTPDPIEDPAQMETAGGLFFRPASGGTGDVIPIYYDGQFYVFFLHGTAKKWCYVTTTDFVNYSEIKGLRAFGGTGDLINVDGTWHLFAGLSDGNAEIIHHYVGEEIDNLRDTYQNIVPDEEKFNYFAWRDPRVWYDEGLEKYCMLVCADVKDGDPVSRNGSVAFLTSDDLYEWTTERAFFNSGYYSGANECPDYFKMGDWYYLVYSDCSYGKRTYYAKSQNPYGPWEIPDNDTFDSLFYYAAKTASDGKNRYLFGWAGDRTENTMALDKAGDLIDPNFATIAYAGSMVVHRLVQQPNGDLTVAPAESQLNAFEKVVKNTFIPLSGEWTTGDDTAAVTAENTFAAMLMQNLPDSFVLTFDLKADAKQAGFALNVNSTFEGKGWYFNFDRQYSRLQMVSGIRSGIAGYYFPYESELERPLQMEAGKTYHVTVLVDGEIAVVYVDDRIALTTRMISDGNQALGLYCYAGSLEISNLAMKK